MFKEEASLASYSSVNEYYSSWESRIGYWLVLGGTRHFGYYKPGTKWPFPINAALRRMEDHLFGFLGLPAGSKVLDAGCGTCDVAIHLARRGLRVQGVDVTDFHVQWAQQNIRDWGLEDKVTVEVADYHHLDSIPDNSLDGVYTLETFVHARDPKQVLQEFFRVLKPGGSLALYEYWYIAYPELPSDTPEYLIESTKRISKRGAMPTKERLSRGVLRSWLEEQQFIDVDEEDLSENIRPMARLFYVMAYIPFLIISFLGLHAWFVNTEAGVQGYRGLRRKVWGYHAVRATKPVSKAMDDSNGTGARSRKVG
ncbi:MAG: hypothetical protein Q9216_005179 [Gyalolechia sp. 2 TL-2023]